MTTATATDLSTSPTGLHIPSTGLRALGALIAVETLKLRRSMVWYFVLTLPLLAVVTGTGNILANDGVLSRSWESLTSQVTLFYGLFFFSVGVALLATAVWRPEHRGTSWNAMRTTSHSPALLVTAKTVTILAPVAVMQSVLVVLTWVGGLTVLHLGGTLPPSFAVAEALGVLTAVPLVAAQSLLSMLLRSFGAPVAMGLAGTMVGIGVSANLPAAAGLFPHSLSTRALTLGSQALSTAGSLSLNDITGVLVWAALSGALWWGLLLLAARQTGGAR